MSLRILLPRLISFPKSRFYCRTPNSKLFHGSCTSCKIPSTPSQNSLRFIRKFHRVPPLLCSNEGIPPYLQDIASKVSITEEDLLELFKEETEAETDIENEIMDFFLARALSYEETEGVFTTACPSCSQGDQSHELFIDKTSGYSICPWCYWEGNWQELIDLSDSREDCLTKEQLDAYLSSLTPINDSHSNLLTTFPYKNVNAKGLQAIGAGIFEDQSQIGIPLLGDEDKPVGFVSISLIHPTPKAVRRCIRGQNAVFYNHRLHAAKKKKSPNVLVVSNILDAFHLSKYKIDAVAINPGSNTGSLEWIFKDAKNVTFCLENRCLSNSLLSYLQLRQVKCSVMRITRPLMALQENDIKTAIKEAITITSNDILSFDSLQHEVYDRIINKEKVCGVKWKRFTDLNDLLMGHRTGELTVFTGLTGSGKTTFIAEYSLDLCTQGVRTLWGSFEVSLPRLCEVMLQQFHGSPLPSDLFEFRAIASQFTTLPLYFLNFHGQKPLEEVIKVMTEAVLTKGVTHVIIDNLQFMMGIHGGSMEWWLEQDRAVAMFRQFATSLKCHVTLIVHPRKLQPSERLSLHTIGGGARVSQEADNIMILQTAENRDGTPNTLGPKTLQVVKNRYGGSLGEIRLRFHKESLTLSSIHRNKNSKSQNSGIPLPDVRGLPEFDEHDLVAK